jgi:hypothetical protein
MAKEIKKKKKHQTRRKQTGKEEQEKECRELWQQDLLRKMWALKAPQSGIRSSWNHHFEDSKGRNTRKKSFFVIQKILILLLESLKSNFFSSEDSLSLPFEYKAIKIYKTIYEILQIGILESTEAS